MRLGGEAGDVADLDQQPGGAGGPDAVEVEQGCSGGGDELLEFLIGGLAALIDALEVRDQLSGDAAPCFAGGVAGAHGGQ